MKRAKLLAILFVVAASLPLKTSNYAFAAIYHDGRASGLMGSMFEPRQVADTR